MTQSKKYDYRISQDKKTWTTEIIRRVTSKRTTVSKTQDGFATEAEAKAWGESELASFLANLTKKNKRDSEQHMHDKKEKALREEANKKRKLEIEKAALEKPEPESASTKNPYEENFGPDFVDPEDKD